MTPQFYMFYGILSIVAVIFGCVTATTLATEFSIYIIKNKKESWGKLVTLIVVFMAICLVSGYCKAVPGIIDIIRELKAL